MEHTDLYDLLRQLSEGGREVAAKQQGLDGHNTTSETAMSLLPHHASVAKAYAKAPADQSSAWHGMPQAGISLTDVARYVYNECSA